MGYNNFLFGEASGSSLCLVHFFLFQEGRMKRNKKEQTNKNLFKPLIGTSIVISIHIPIVKWPNPKSTHQGCLPYLNYP